MSQGLVTFPGVGCVVEFMQGNAPQIAWVLEEQSGKLRLLLPNRRETTIPIARILPWSGPQEKASCSRDEAVNLLEQHKKQRLELEETLNPLEWWELAEGEMLRAGAQWFAELIDGQDNANVVSACAHVLLNCKTHFKFQIPDFEIYTREAVERRLEEQAQMQQREALVTQGSVFLRGLYDHYLHQRPLPAEENFDAELLKRLKRTLLERMAHVDSTADDSIWKQWIKGLPDDPFLAFYLAQGWGLVEPHHNVWLDRAGYTAGDDWATDYASEIQQLETCNASLTALPECDLPFVSIDNATTRDIDDAFYLERLPEEHGWRLVVALACPVLHWDFEGTLDNAVRQRATSVYLPEQVSHMLPESLGEGLYSLFAATERPALIVECLLNKDGTVQQCMPSLARVKLAANLTYDAVESCIEGTANTDNQALPFKDMLIQAHILAQHRQTLRVRNGAVIIDRPELQITLCGTLSDPQLDVQITEETPAVAAHLLVSEQMILVNTALAYWAEERQISLYHRTQVVDIPKEYHGVWSDLLDVARVVKVLAPACIETSPRLHAGIGETHYAPSTSPLRRYTDFINEAQILWWLQNNTPRWTKMEMDTMLTVINSRLDAAGQVQRVRPRYWKLIHVRHRLDFWWRSVITDENDTMFFVNIPDLQLFLRARKTLFAERDNPGSVVEVRLGKVRPLQGEVNILEVRESAFE